MDSIASKITKHSNILTAYLQELADSRNQALGNTLEYQVVADHERHHYQLVRLGWTDGRFSYFVLLHFDIKPDTGKIWVQQNNTEILVGQELVDKGVSKSNIVLGFKSAELRPYSGYAAA
jgi:XisI protein